MKKEIILIPRQQGGRPKLSFAEWSRTVHDRIAEEAQKTVPTQVGRHYPMLVVRVMPAVYVNVPIRIETGELATCFGLKTSFVRHPAGPVLDGPLPDEVRDAIVVGVKSASSISQLKKCIVWSEAETTYVEPDGTIFESSQAPRGGGRIRGKHL